MFSFSYLWKHWFAVSWGVYTSIISTFASFAFFFKDFILICNFYKTHFDLLFWILMLGTLVTKICCWSWKYMYVSTQMWRIQRIFLYNWEVQFFFNFCIITIYPYPGQNYRKKGPYLSHNGKKWERKDGLLSWSSLESLWVVGGVADVNTRNVIYLLTRIPYSIELIRAHNYYNHY